MPESTMEMLRVCVNVIKLVEKHKDLNIRNNMGSFYFIKMLTRIKKCVVAFAIKC